MKTTTPRTPTSPTIRSTNRPANRRFRIVGALASATAVAVIGTGAMTPAAAQAAGVTTGHRIPAPASAPLADPAATTTTSTSGEVVTYRIHGGRLERV